MSGNSTSSPVPALVWSAADLRLHGHEPRWRPRHLLRAAARRGAARRARNVADHASAADRPRRRARYWQQRQPQPIAVGCLDQQALDFSSAARAAAAAAAVSDAVLQWTYVAYLVALIALLILRRDRGRTAAATCDRNQPPWSPLLLIGCLPASSGFMGIGGGLAITVGLQRSCACRSIRRSSSASFSRLSRPTFLAAWIYWSKGLMVGWPAIIGIVAGLWIVPISAPARRTASARRCCAGP